MQKIITLKCPKCNNNHRFHKFGKDKFGNQKYRCLECKHQFAPDYKLKLINILLVLCVEKLHFYTMIIVIIQILDVVIKGVIIHFLFLNQRQPYHHQFQIYLEKRP